MTLTSFSVSTSLPNRAGPVTPPMPVPTAQKKARAMARVSMGNISLPVR